MSRYKSVADELFARYAYNAFDEEENEHDIAFRTEGYTAFELEVGSGNGKFLVEHAEERPDTFFIGIEWSRKAVNKSAKKAGARDLANVLFILGEANAVIEMHLAPHFRFNAVYVNFPDPWPKKRHRKRRIVEDGFIAKAHALLKPDAPFYLVTDFKEYAEETMSPAMDATPLFRNALDTPWTHALDGYKKTLYEEKMRALRKAIYYFKYLRNDVTSA